MNYKLKLASLLVLSACSAAFADEPGDSSKGTSKIVLPGFEKQSAGPSAAAKKGDFLKLPSMDSSPERSPFLDTKQIVYPYDPNSSYPVITRPGMYTQIDLPEGFVVEGFYLSNVSDEDWQHNVSANGKHVFIKPLRSGLFNSGSIISGDTSYLLALTSNDTGEWYQRVKWTMTKSQLKRYKTIQAGADVDKTQPEKDTKQFFENYASLDNSNNFIRKPGVDVAKINTNWKIEGSAIFKPTSVYDDGQFTYIVFPKNLGEVPAVFSMPEEGETELVNYVIEGEDRNQIKVTKLLTGGLLKIGKAEIKLTNLNFKKKFSFFGLFDVDSKEPSEPNFLNQR